jgi:hypothetical protein
MSLSEETAFSAMKAFLELYWERTGKGNQIGDLIADLDNEFTIDGSPHDPAVWNEWIEVCKQVSHEDRGLR